MGIVKLIPIANMLVTINRKPANVAIASKKLVSVIYLDSFLALSQRAISCALRQLQDARTDGQALLLSGLDLFPEIDAPRLQSRRLPQLSRESGCPTKGRCAGQPGAHCVQAAARFPYLAAHTASFNSV
jgi:hypothetical protein